MKRFARSIPAEVVFTAGMLLVMLGLAAHYRLPILWPQFDSAAFIGVHYLFPFLGTMVWGVCATLGQRNHRTRILLVALPCYTVVLWAHFNIKLWTPHINPNTYDALYWSVDQSARPLIEACFGIRRWMLCVFPYDFNAYMYAFILLFYVSFCYHALHRPQVLRQLILSVLFMQGLGALSYLAFPALGPFIFEEGVNPSSSATQHYMLMVHNQSLLGGADWLAANGSHYLLAGLGAMPSLHAGGSFLFLWFAARHGRILLPAYLPVFVYILVTAIANRWHYLLDLPFGILLAAVSIGIANRLVKGPAPSEQPVAEPAVVPLLLEA